MGGEYNVECKKLKNKIKRRWREKGGDDEEAEILVFTRLMLKRVHVSSSRVCFCSCSVISVIMFLPST